MQPGHPAFDPVEAALKQLYHAVTNEAVPDDFLRILDDIDAKIAAAKKIPKRKTITPAWDRSDPRRLTKLMESPWEETSKGIACLYRQISVPVSGA